MERKYDFLVEWEKGLIQSAPVAWRASETTSLKQRLLIDKPLHLYQERLWFRCSEEQLSHPSEVASNLAPKISPPAPLPSRMNAVAIGYTTQQIHRIPESSFEIPKSPAPLPIAHSPPLSVACRHFLAPSFSSPGPNPEYSSESRVHSRRSLPQPHSVAMQIRRVVADVSPAGAQSARDDRIAASPSHAPPGAPRRTSPLA